MAYDPNSNMPTEYLDDENPLGDGENWFEQGDNTAGTANSLEEGWNQFLEDLKKWSKDTQKELKKLGETVDATSSAPVAKVATGNTAVKATVGLGGAKISVAGPLGTFSIGLSGGNVNFGFGLQASIAAANAMPPGPTKDAIVAKTEASFGAILKAKGTTVSAQISAGNAAIGAGVSLGSKGVLNLKVSFSGKITNNAQNIKIADGGPKPEGQHAPKSNLELNKNKKNAAIAFALQFGGSGAVRVKTTLGTNYDAPKIGLSGTMGGFKVAGSIPTSYAFEQTKEGGYVLVGTGVKSNTYEQGEEHEAEPEDVAGVVDDFEEEETMDFENYGPDDEDDDGTGDTDDSTEEAEDGTADGEDDDEDTDNENDDGEY